MLCLLCVDLFGDGGCVFAGEGGESVYLDVVLFLNLFDEFVVLVTALELPQHLLEQLLLCHSYINSI